MKKVLFSLFAIVALFVVSSCSSSETMNKLNGTWETTSTFDFDKGDISVRIADEAISAFDLSTTDVVSTIQEVKNGLKDEYKGVGLEKIKSLTDNELVVDEEGTVFTLHRVK